MKLSLSLSFLLIVVTRSLGEPQHFSDAYPVQRQSFGPVRGAASRSIGGRQPVFEPEAQDIDFEPRARQPPPASIERNFLQSIHSVTTTSTAQPVAKIVKQLNQQNQDGSYTFGYESQDGSFRVETRGLDGIIKGKYGYLDQHGELKEVEYTAGGQFGYEPSGKGIMVPPRAPARQKTPFDEDEPDYDEEGNPIRAGGRRGSPVAAPQPAPQFQPQPQAPPAYQQQQALQRAPPSRQSFQAPVRQSFQQPQPLPRASLPPRQESFQPPQPQFSAQIPREPFSRSPEIRQQPVPQQQLAYPEPQPQPLPVAPPIRHQKNRSPLSDFFTQQRQHRFK